MSLDILDSFEHYDTARVLQKASFNRGWSGGWTISSAAALGAAATGLETNSIDVAYPLPAATRKIVGVRFRITTNGNQSKFIKFLNAGGNMLCSLAWTQATGFLSAYRGNGLTLLSTASVGSFAFNTTHFLEIDYSPDPTSGIYTVWLDNVQILNPTGNTGNGGPITGIALGQDTQFNHVQWSDLYVLTPSGVVPNARLGPRTVRWFGMGSAASHADFTPVGAASRLAAINKALADLTTYNRDNVLNHRDSFASSTISTITPQGARLLAYARQTNVGQRNLGLTVESGAVDDISADIPLSQSPLFYGRDASVDPNTSALVTLANLNSYKGGYKIKL